MVEQNLLAKLKEVLDELEGLEKHYRKIHNSAVDIEDFEVSQKTQVDAYVKIRKLKDWKNVVVDLNNTISESNIIDMVPSIKMSDDIPNKNESSNATLNESETINEEPDKNEIIDALIEELSEHEIEGQTKIGEYVRSKMHDLSSSGFTFSDSDIKKMQEKRWTKTVLGIDYAFIRIYNKNHTITKQMKDELGYNRYWKEILNFGKYEILLTSQWFERNRNDFDNWYGELNKSSDTNITTESLENDVKISLYDQEESNCRNPISIRLFDKVYSIKGWNEVLIKVCQIMILKKPYIVATFGRETTLNSNQCANFSYTESEIKGNKKRLSNGLWIETNINANDVENVSKRILELCGFSENDLTIDFE